MPSRAPVFRPPGARHRKPWQRPRNHVDKRIRGRKGVRLRREVLREEPLCRECQAHGRTTASAEVDHIVPLAEGGSNERSNLQALCIDCHKVKTLAEGGRGAGERHDG